METGETGETVFYIVFIVKWLGCEKDLRICSVSRKCYFCSQFPVLEPTVSNKDSYLALLWPLARARPCLTSPTGEKGRSPPEAARYA